MWGNQESVYLRACWASSLLVMDRILSGTKMGWTLSCRWCESTRQAKVNMRKPGASSSPLNAIDIRKIRQNLPDRSGIGMMKQWHFQKPNHLEYQSQPLFGLLNLLHLQRCNGLRCTIYKNWNICAILLVGSWLLDLTTRLFCGLSVSKCERINSDGPIRYHLSTGVDSSIGKTGKPRASRPRAAVAVLVGEPYEGDSPCWKAGFQAKVIHDHNQVHRIISLHLSNIAVAAIIRPWSHRSRELSLIGYVSGTTVAQRKNDWEVYHSPSLPITVITILCLILCTRWHKHVMDQTR